MPNSCGCSLAYCLHCLREHARGKIQQRSTPSCLNCLSPLPLHLTSALIKNECPLCPAEGEGTRGGGRPLKHKSLISLRCGHDHRFCVECAGKHVVAELEARRVPRCPRAVECSCTMEEGVVRSVLSSLLEVGGETRDGEGRERAKGVEARMLDWHDLRTGQTQSEHPLLRACRAADCQGHIPLPRQAWREGTPVRGECSHCKREYCCQCLSPPHPGRSCAAAEAAAEAWMGFLRSAALKEAGGEGEGQGGNLIEGASSLLLKMEQMVADREYLSRQCKRCPKCRRVIEKVRRRRCAL